MSTTALKESGSISTTIAPWLSVKDGLKAVAFYKAAFAARETYRLEMPDGGLVVKLSVDGAEFWLSGEGSQQDGNIEPVGGGTIKIILTVANPDALFTRALEAGATEIFPIGEDYGWRLGRIADPFGLHWEIGHPLAT
jgi:PhnB protein